jgi:isopentenyldiphosphate isomerase
MLTTQPSPDMIVDIVDAADRVVGAAPRKELFRIGQGFRVAHVFVFNKDGHLLVQRLAPVRDRHPLRWGSSVAAYLFAGETYADAARRRLDQELSVADPSPIPVLHTSMTDDGCVKWISLFRVAAEGPFSPDHGHIADLEFRPLDVLGQQVAAAPDDFTPTFVHLFRLFRARQQP